MWETIQWALYWSRTVKSLRRVNLSFYPLWTRLDISLTRPDGKHFGQFAWRGVIKGCRVRGDAKQGWRVTCKSFLSPASNIPRCEHAKIQLALYFSNGRHVHTVFHLTWSKSCVYSKNWVWGQFLSVPGQCDHLYVTKYGCLCWGYISKPVDRRIFLSWPQTIDSHWGHQLWNFFWVLSQYPTVRWPMGVKAGIAGQIKLPAHADIDCCWVSLAQDWAKWMISNTGINNFRVLKFDLPTIMILWFVLK